MQVEFDALEDADLVKDAVYKGGYKNDLSSEPISKLLPVGNQSGIRFSGKAENPRLVVLYTTFSDKDWPDTIVDDMIVYYGDNKSPGKEVHELPGNRVLRAVFDRFYLSDKKDFPPIFLFSKGELGFDRVYRGLLRPGYKDLAETEDLIAVWKTKNNRRFQNYKAFFTILSDEVFERSRINKLIQ
ncbi:MAG: hypothetical protein JNL17_07610 [Cyclobacteriaceae bacterium]|nr:hypothetical protein [Cyclobacteriaceae bacterium]